MMKTSFFSLTLLGCALSLVSNLPNINKQASPALGGVSKTPQDILFSGDSVCDKFSSTIQSNNDTTDFPIDFNLYVATTESAPNDNYTVDLYFKNPRHNSLNQFAILNTTDKPQALEQYNPQLISQQPGFGVEFKFDFSKGLLCQFLYEFQVIYQLERQNDTSAKSDKIFLVGSCQLNQQYHPNDYNTLIDQGFRCVEYNSGFKYDGGKDWCSKFYPSDQCCDLYQNDELVARDTCPTKSGVLLASAPTVAPGPLDRPNGPGHEPRIAVASTLTTKRRA